MDLESLKSFLDEFVASFSKESNTIKAYHKVYKLGINLPTLL
ncbi:hypothetical protein [Kaistella carnis]|nr:hypothetical protein [Kaistella carnis]